MQNHRRETLCGNHHFLIKGVGRQQLLSPLLQTCLWPFPVAHTCNEFCSAVRHTFHNYVARQSPGQTWPETKRISLESAL